MLLNCVFSSVAPTNCSLYFLRMSSVVSARSIFLTAASTSSLSVYIGSTNLLNAVCRAASVLPLVMAALSASVGSLPNMSLNFSSALGITKLLLIKAVSPDSGCGPTNESILACSSAFGSLPNNLKNAVLASVWSVYIGSTNLLNAVCRLASVFPDVMAVNSLVVGSRPNMS